MLDAGDGNRSNKNMRLSIERCDDEALLDAAREDDLALHDIFYSDEVRESMVDEDAQGCSSSTSGRDVAFEVRCRAALAASHR